jgi:hypothetical protein
MLHTAEVRWFVQGSLPDQVLDWFSQGISPRGPDVRDDRYLALPGCEATGVKLRRGTSLDVKARVGDGEAVSYGSGIAGVRESWVKWSSENAQIIEGLAAVSAGGKPWLGVRKERHLRLFTLESARPVELEAYAGTSIGCHVELTRVLVGDAPAFEAWTLGLEAYGERDLLEEALDATAMRLFTERPRLPTSLARAASMGYPAWLNRLPRGGW